MPGVQDARKWLGVSEFASSFGCQSPAPRLQDAEEQGSRSLHEEAQTTINFLAMNYSVGRGWDNYTNLPEGRGKCRFQ